METQTIFKSNSQSLYLQSFKSCSKYKTGLKCRCCKVSSNLTIHHIVPRIIGKAFNEEFLKCPTIVLCENCHDRYERAADKVKSKYSSKLNINLNTPKHLKNKLNTLRPVGRAARALIGVDLDSISAAKLERYRNIILDHLEQPYYTSGDLFELSKIPNTKYIKVKNPHHIDFGKALLELYSIEEIKSYWINHWEHFECHVKATIAA